MVPRAEAYARAPGEGAEPVLVGSYGPLSVPATGYRGGQAAARGYPDGVGVLTK